MKKKKRLKILLIVLAAVIISVLAFIYVLPKMYLAHKYDTKTSDYKIVDFSPAGFRYDLASGFEWYNPKWELKHDGRDFNVVMLGVRLYDDYQLEDVEKWLIEELQTNIDKNISFVIIGSSLVFGIFDENNDVLGDYKNIVWTRNNIKLLLKSMPHPAICYYYGDNVKLNDEIKDKAKQNLEEIDEIYNDGVSNYVYSNSYLYLEKLKPIRINRDYDRYNPSSYIPDFEENKRQIIQ